METEKVCVNLSAAELGAIDVLVAQGLFTTRSDLIRAGIRAITDLHVPTLNRATKNATCFGVMLLTPQHLEQVVRQGGRLRVFVVGILRIDSRVTPELADQAIEHVQLLGSLKASAPVVARIEGRVSRNLDAASWL